MRARQISEIKSNSAQFGKILPYSVGNAGADATAAQSVRAGFILTHPGGTRLGLDVVIDVQPHQNG